MSLHQWLGVGAGVLLIGFIVFAFRQGMKVKPDDRPDRGPSVGTGDGSADGA
jgi:hypothetical protein